MSRPKEFDETSVLDRAMELFWDQGYQATSLADLELHLGIGRQSIYDTYGNKLGLYHKALDRYSRVPVTHLLGRLEAGGAQAIRSFFERLIAYQSCPSPQACFMVNSAIELAPCDGFHQSQVRSRPLRPRQDGPPGGGASAYLRYTGALGRREGWRATRNPAPDGQRCPNGGRC
jgi:AcrR family transcriptional regulator